MCDSVIVLCFVVRFFVSILLDGEDNWLLCFVCLPSLEYNAEVLKKVEILVALFLSINLSP